MWSENADGTIRDPMTSLPTGADGVTVSPDGQIVLFTSDVYPAARDQTRRRALITIRL